MKKWLSVAGWFFVGFACLAFSEYVGKLAGMANVGFVLGCVPFGLGAYRAIHRAVQS